MNTTEVATIFPQELYDLVIYNLRDDVPSLTQASLVCHSWLPSCRELIHRLFIFSAEDRDKLESSKRFLSHSPHLIPYVRVLRILGDGTAVIPNYDLLDSIHTLLTSVEALQLHFLPFRLFLSLYGFKRIFKSRTISSVEMVRCGITVQNAEAMFGLCSSLKHLSLTDTGVVPPSPGEIVEKNDAPLSYLHTLEVGGSVHSTSVSSWLTHPHSCISISRLHTLRLSQTLRKPLFDVLNVVLGCAPSLRCLEISDSGFEDGTHARKS